MRILKENVESSENIRFRSTSVKRFKKSMLLGKNIANPCVLRYYKEG